MTNIHRTVAEVLATAALLARASKRSAHACAMALGIGGTAFAQDAAEGADAGHGRSARYRLAHSGRRHEHADARDFAQRQLIFT